MVVLVIIFLISFYSGPSIQENEVLDNKINQRTLDNIDTSVPNEVSDGLTRPKTGLSVHIGDSVDLFTEQWGQPDRVDPGHLELSWLIYNRGPQGYMHVATKDGLVRAIFSLGQGLDVSPYYIGQPLDEIYRFTMINSEIVVENSNGVFQFELSEEDLHSRLLVPFGDIFAQLFIDQFTGVVLGVYFVDKELLIEQRPYELVYRRNLPEIALDQENQREIDEANEMQIFEMTNVIRLQQGVSEVIWEDTVAKLARDHSENMYESSLVENGLPTEGTLADRLDGIEHHFRDASENIASNYHLSHSVIHAWLNSAGHRETMLEEKYTHLGVGVYQLFYTQDFLNYEGEQSLRNNENASIE